MAFTRDPQYLKTILPLSDELTDILKMIFTRDPDHRITLSELKARISRCNSFSLQPQHPDEYADEEPIEDFDSDSDASMSADPSDTDSESRCSSDSGSLTSSSSTISDLDDNDFQDELPSASQRPPVFEEPAIVPYHQDCVTNASYPHGPGPVPPERAVHHAVPHHCQQENPSKGGFHFLPLNLFDSVFRFAPQVPIHPGLMHQQMPILPIFAALQGCY